MSGTFYLRLVCVIISFKLVGHITSETRVPLRSEQRQNEIELAKCNFSAFVVNKGDVTLYFA
jgi:hypothetical protein